jgi:hypothetical protein
MKMMTKRTIVGEQRETMHELTQLSHAERFQEKKRKRKTSEPRWGMFCKETHALSAQTWSWMHGRKQMKRT